MYNKPHIIFDNTKKSIKILILLKKIFNSFSINKSNFLIVIGGDGFMLKSLKKFYHYEKPFYGINSGNYGFLMNKYSNKNFLRNLIKSNLITISPLEMEVKNKKKSIKKIFSSK